MAKFLNKQELQHIAEAIKEAENQSSGEIVVSIIKHAKGDIYQQAEKEFINKGINQTKERNGVLVLLAYKDHKLAILGDQGINQKVQEDFWDESLKLMTSHFKSGHYAQGLSEGILHIGEQLKQYFPWQEGDQNELGDDVHVEA